MRPRRRLVPSCTNETENFQRRPPRLHAARSDDCHRHFLRGLVRHSQPDFQLAQQCPPAAASVSGCQPGAGALRRHQQPGRRRLQRQPRRPGFARQRLSRLQLDGDHRGDRLESFIRRNVRNPSRQRQTGNHFTPDHDALPAAVAARQPRRRPGHERTMNCQPHMKLPIADCRLPIAPKMRRHRLSIVNHPSSIVNNHAFTLIEIMVAVMVFSLVIAAIYSTWAMVMRATQVGQDTAAQAQRQRVVLRAIGDALMGVESFQASQKYYWFRLANGGEPYLSFVAHLPDSYARNGKFVGAAAGRDCSSRRVTFTLAAGENGEKDLILRQSPILIEDSEEQKDEEKFPLVLARNVKAFSIEWWGTNNLNNAEWNKDWDDTQTNTMPQMVRVHLGNGVGLGVVPVLVPFRIVQIVGAPPFDAEGLDVPRQHERKFLLVLLLFRVLYENGALPQDQISFTVPARRKRKGDAPRTGAAPAGGADKFSVARIAVRQARDKAQER